MKAKDFLEKCGLTVAVNGAPENEITCTYCCDLLSIVIGKAPAGCAWVTVMGNMNSVAVASLADVSACVICEDCEVTNEIIDTAKGKGVNLLRTSLPLYEFCVELSKNI